MYKLALLFCCIVALHTSLHASQEHKNETWQPKSILKQATAATTRTAKSVTFQEAAPTEEPRAKGEPQRRIVQPLVNIDAPTDLQDVLGDTSLIIAARHGSLELVERLMQRRANPEIKNFNLPPRTALSEAADQGRLPIVRFLVEQKAQVNYEDMKDRNPLSFAAAATTDDSLSIVEFLLKMKANANAQDENGNCALHFAVFYSKTEIIRSLLAGGANPRITNTDKLAPLLFARKDEIKKIFVEAASSTNQKS